MGGGQNINEPHRKNEKKILERTDHTDVTQHKVTLPL